MEIAISLLGGLGLFLYGMNIMAEGLQKSAGDKLKRIVEKLTSNTFMGVIVGTVVTAIIQSSSAATVMVVGFVNAGIMNLTQAIGVIMGANIGTTVTAQLVSFKLEAIAPVALGIGIVMYLFSKKQKTKELSLVLLGFGILFTGMEFMKDAVKPLAEFEGFRNALIYFGNHQILGILAGFLITGIIQSSSASMGMLIVLASEGLIPLSAALPILYGDNIGTCVTSLISSIGASRNAKRAAIMHLTFNIIGTIIFMLVLNYPITKFVTYLDPTDSARQIANAHSIFNIVNVIILLPFAKYIVKLVLKFMPITEDENEEQAKTKYLDERILQTPSIALGNTVKEVIRMGEKANKSLEHSMKSLVNKSSADVEKTVKYEETVNTLQKEILNYLLQLSKSPLNDEERHKVDLLFNTVNDIERVSDHAENISELSSIAIEKDLTFSDNAIEEMQNIYNKASENFTLSLKCLEEENKEMTSNIYKVEEEVNALEKLYKKKHMERLNDGSCTIDSGVLFLDLLTNLERVSDHSCNIANQVVSH
ncbi:MAG: Na/Pi cotransporter family protein [Terrisporobacter sp.]